MKAEHRRNFIVRQLVLGYGKNEVFRQLCAKLEIEQKLDDQQLDTMFYSIEKDHALGGRNLTSQHCVLIKEIYNVFKLFNRGVEERGCQSIGGCKLVMLTDRYALDFTDSTKYCEPFFLVDTFHGRRRPIKCTSYLDLLQNSKIYPIDEENFFVVDHNRRTFRTCISLFQLDFESLSCKIVNSQIITGDVWTVVFDSKCKEKFVLWVWLLNEVSYFRRGRIVKNKIDIDEQLLPIDCKLIVSSLKLEGNTICGLASEGRKYYLFKKLTLSQTSVSNYDYCRIKCLGTLWIRNEFKTCCIWVKEKCYMLHDFEGKNPQLLEFDLGLEEVRKIEVKDLASFKDMRLDENGILTICLLGCYKGQHVARRVPLKQPDKLQVIALLEVQKQTVLMDERKYGRFLNTLPPWLRPFSGYFD